MGKIAHTKHTDEDGFVVIYGPIFVTQNCHKFYSEYLDEIGKLASLSKKNKKLAHLIPDEVYIPSPREMYKEFNNFIKLLEDKKIISHSEEKEDDFTLMLSSLKVTGKGLSICSKVQSNILVDVGPFEVPSNKRDFRDYMKVVVTSCLADKMLENVVNSDNYNKNSSKAGYIIYLLHTNNDLIVFRINSYP